MRVTHGLQQRNLPSPVWQQGQYYSNPTLTFVAAAISTPCKLPSLAYESANSGRAETREAETVDHKGLYLFALLFGRFDRGNAYKEFLVHFSATEARSGRCVLTGQRYSTASELCLGYLHKQRHYPRTDDEGARRLVAWALECLPSLLDQSSETEALVRSAKLASKVGNLPAAESMAKAAIERYLSRCTKFLAN